MFLYSIRKCKKTLKFDNVEVDKKEFHTSKQTIALVNVDQILVSDKFKHSDTSFKFFIGYNDDYIIRPLCSILPQTSGFVKYFGNNKKICPVRLKMMPYCLNIVMFRTKLKILKA